MIRFISTNLLATLVTCAICLMVAGCDKSSPSRSPTSPSPTTTSAPDPTGGPPTGPSGSVTGVVKDAVTNQPLAAAAVAWAGLAEALGDRGDGVRTGVNGAYHMQIGPLGGPGSREGRFVMQASKEGYINRTVEATLADGLTVDFNLQPAPAANGTMTWTSIATTRTLCNDLTKQVGTTYPLWLQLQSQGNSVILKLSHDGPIGPPPDDPSGTWEGTRTGDVINAAYKGPMGGLACPSDVDITPQTGGELTATSSASTLSGRYTEVYGTGSDAVTLIFRFQASF